MILAEKIHPAQRERIERAIEEPSGVDRAAELERQAEQDIEARREAEAVAGPEGDEEIRTDGGESNAHASRVAAQLAMADGESDAEALPELFVGDHVQDREDPDATMVVVGLDTLQADAYELEDDLTVADVNTEYPADADVVEVVFPDRTDMDIDQRRYAYPRSRLERVESVHDVGGDDE